MDTIIVQINFSHLVKAENGNGFRFHKRALIITVCVNRWWKTERNTARTMILSQLVAAVSRRQPNATTNSMKITSLIYYEIPFCIVWLMRKRK